VSAAEEVDPSDYERPSVRGVVELAPRVRVFVRFNREPCADWPQALWRGVAVLEAPAKSDTYETTARTLKEAWADLASWAAKRLGEVSP
jgi:hypothetical protein